MTTKEECDKEFQEVLGEDYPYTLNNIKKEDIEAYLNATGKTDQEKTEILKRIIGGKRCLSICDANLSDAACRHKKRFYFGLVYVNKFDPTNVKHHLIYNNSNNLDVNLRHVMLEFKEGIEENEEQFYENLTNLDELYKLGDKNIDEINDLEKFVIENYVYFYLKNQTKYYDFRGPSEDSNKTISGHYKLNNIESEGISGLPQVYLIEDKIGSMNVDIEPVFYLMYDQVIENKSVVYRPKGADLKINFETDKDWYTHRDTKIQTIDSELEDRKSVV